MTNPNDPPVSFREVVGLFADMEGFESAATSLLDRGFDRTDLSVLASHESLDAAGKPGRPLKDVLAALVGELKYEGPLVASGAILLAGGPTAAAIAGVIGAATAGAAAKETLDDLTAAPHTEDFARSLDAGSVILWVRVTDSELEERAAEILARHGGTNVHVHETTPND